MIKNGKIAGLFNVLDLFIVLVIIAATIIIAPNFTGKKISSAENSTVVYFTLRVLEASESVAGEVEIGDRISDNIKNFYYGIVDNVEITEAEKIVENNVKGVFEVVTVPGAVDVDLTVKCNGIETDRDISVEGHVIKIGNEMIIKGKGYAMAGYVTEIRTERGEQ